ncbi:uncharacterized protein LOC130656398 [Hydractinia symbiolongicarpus]|uniref:uncharacterized protein LOC130614306 n=4 Tax=Hydractinia symbiolongicarpus TaxID=13093 RepID=UPI0025513EE4|nr:uncharacterized protein LOC130614306 [Hydractinia symbiolongicarpus]XP_057292857.1 uncharacterized protein LOC130621569 [Hydractinia symbiolongicarpus]XP_057311699.1 uncharacterized protein LOC130649443 [Hydractinia symbiolongicarpus]XP_057315229.1 uncharacterized protein LOC130656398 [Hydractinia symbiolongicarpus]
MAYLKRYRKNIAEVNKLARSSDSDDAVETHREGGNQIFEECYIESNSCSMDCDIDSTDTVNDSGSSSDEEWLSDAMGNITLSEELASWAVRNRVTRNSVNELLDILRKNGHTLPKDSRTLLKTPRNVNTDSICAGKYVYLGIENGIRRMLLNNPNITVTEYIKLAINIDGIPLYKSSSTQFWPILGQFEYATPFVIALFCGNSKPTPVEYFCHEFLEELHKLRSDTMIVNDIDVRVALHFFTCDAPARQFLKGIKGHTGYDGCERCTVAGEYIEGRIIFNDIDKNPRTDAGFLKYEYKKHQLKLSPLIQYNICCVTDFVLDYMHLVCLGVVKRLLNFLIKDGPRLCKLSRNQITLISSKLVQLNGTLPSEFVRQPRSLNEFCRWKATEFRQFLLFTGPIVLKGILSKEAFTHFLSLSIAIKIMLESNGGIRSAYLNYAHQLLEYFVTNSQEFYGNYFCSYNVHNLIHLSSDVEKFNLPLDAMSCFPFENYLQILFYVLTDSSIMSPEVRPLIQHQNTTPTHTPPNSLKRKHVSPVRQTPSGSQNAGGSSGNDPFPMSTGKFQKRVLYLLTDIRNLLGRQNEKAAEPDTAQPQEPFELLKSVQELIEFEETLKDKSNYDRLLSQLSRVGGSKIRENVKNVLLK